MPFSRSCGKSSSANVMPVLDLSSVAWMAWMGSKVEKEVWFEHDVTFVFILERGRVALGTGPGTYVPSQWSRM